MQKAFAAKPGYGLVVTGHSLGAGTSILLTFLINAKKDKGEMPWVPKPVCWAYAPPPVITKDAAAKAGLEIYAFVNRFDVVPRASLRNVFALGVEVMAVDQLPLGFLERLTLIRKGPGDGEQKQQIVQAVAGAVKTNQKFPPLYIAGKVFWLEWPETPGQDP